MSAISSSWDGTSRLAERLPSIYDTCRRIYGIIGDGNLPAPRCCGQILSGHGSKEFRPSQKKTLKQFGAELIEAELKDRASLDLACPGASAVVTTPTAISSGQEGDTFQTVDLEGQKSLIDAASAAKVVHYVFVSVSSNLGKQGGNPLIDAKRSVENHLGQSGLTYTILRPSFFMEIWLSPHLGFDFQNAKATIYGSGKNKISYVSLHNVADFVVEALSNPASRNGVIELGGPEALSPIEVVHIFEELAGRTFETQFIPEEQLQSRKAAASNPVEQTFADLMLSACHGDSIDMSETFKKFSVRPKSVREYAKMGHERPSPALRSTIAFVLAEPALFQRFGIVKPQIISVDPEIMSGAPCFAGTRVPIQNLIDYLEGGASIEDFLEGFPSVSREQVIAFLEEAKDRVLAAVEK
jgi:uncharacterized protein YbjT (DUF2867 family)/uncharacterized protein (DUF433 family)